MFIWSYENNALIEKQTINLRNRFESISTKTMIETLDDSSSRIFTGYSRAKSIKTRIETVSLIQTQKSTFRRVRAQTRNLFFLVALPCYGSSWSGSEGRQIWFYILKELIF